MFSMTGYGSGSSETGSFTVKTELQSYNHRFLDIKVKLPSQYQSLESYITKKISRRLSRGRVNVYIAFKPTGDRYRVKINETLAKKYWNSFKRLQKVVNAEASIGLEALIELPGVLETSAIKPSVTGFKRQVAGSLNQALDELISMRGKEGGRMKSDLSRHIRSLNGCLIRVKARLKTKDQEIEAENKGESYRNSAGERPGVANVQEETSRLDSHIVQFKEFLESDQPSGKSLEFLCQEMLREVTTLGDKASDSLISRQIIIMKSELESLREQARNVE
ncbi:MAG: DUF1732 domain-containing protein [Candidatus Auribacterota bacterium]|nr:DUF1732 domain-containing protein [Candidatus Auribacterota bacterium]